LAIAPTRFDESQLVRWQKDGLQRATAAQVRDWLAPAIAAPPPRFDMDGFVELVRHNVVLPADAAPWAAAVYGQLAPLSAESRGIVTAAGAPFFAAAVQAYEQAPGDWKAMTAVLKQSTGKSGAGLFMPLRIALTGQSHGPELAPLLKLMPAELARQRLQSHA
jgi:nondiscriminating glutamyl-tRNA synthetase